MVSANRGYESEEKYVRERETETPATAAVFATALCSQASFALRPLLFQAPAVITNNQEFADIFREIGFSKLDTALKLEELVGLVLE